MWILHSHDVIILNITLQPGTTKTCVSGCIILKSYDILHVNTAIVTDLAWPCEQPGYMKQVENISKNQTRVF